MKDTLIFFDIDETLFDPKAHIELVLRHLAGKWHREEKTFLQEAWEAFRNMRKTMIFTPANFAKSLAKHYQKNEREIENTFWEKKFFSLALYKDVLPVMKQLSKRATIGILSTGDSELQKAKVASLTQHLSQHDLHIFSAKENELQNVFAKYQGKHIYFVDNINEMLRLAKAVKPELITVWIKRKEQKNREEKFQPDFTIISLTELISLTS